MIYKFLFIGTKYLKISVSAITLHQALNRLPRSENKPLLIARVSNPIIRNLTNINDESEIKKEHLKQNL
ncbi:hypothetical protein MHD_00910 [Mannheimia granulomatis]|uniref:Uncharacterized protein n=1 Tax=Mannheimia granulomatis TaxID=85402 RepID=A0A011MI31_9PAST|nr:hypothetical protein [Mannheimia granulomatis]EXI62136.1 hypothetical protein AK33_07630 [Mannheimia granulomatis]RGE49179.1 hypothetical protein MHD_00910 [Mannheimia granulomatis]